MGLFAVSIFRSFLQKKRSNRLLNLQKKELEQLALRLETLNSIDKAILQAETFKDIIYNTIKELSNKFPVIRASITFFNFDKGTFSPFSISGKGKSRLDMGLDFPLQEFGGIDTLKTHAPYIVEDLSRLNSLSDSDKILMEEGVGSYILTPIVAKGELLASLNICFSERRAITVGMVNLLLEITNGIGISIIQHRLQEKLREQHTSITDSINYARKIQDAILPPLKMVEKILPDSFIFYRPKDIISGDFYWIERTGTLAEKNALIFFAVADCTGHGVPGAMVSVMCNNALNRSIKEFHLKKTSKILHKVHELVFASLHSYSDQDTLSLEEVKDGMDIALCCFNPQNLSLEYAGANNPLYYITTEKFHEIKGDAFAIGSYYSNVSFTNHIVPITSDTCFYLFSDGFADQFGGPKGKKYMSSRFKTLLRDRHRLTMADQKTILCKEFDEWKGPLEQIDDVCVMGIRLR